MFSPIGYTNISSAICFNCAENIKINYFLEHINQCLSKGNNDQMPNFFCSLISKLTTGQHDYQEVLYLYNKETQKQLCLCRRKTNTSTDNEDESFSQEEQENENISSHNLFQFQDISKDKEYLDFTSNTKRVKNVTNILRFVTKDEIKNSKCYF